MALISEKYNFIFIHIYKCGGNSMRRYLRSPSVQRPEINQLETYEVHGVHCDIRDVKHHFYTADMQEFYDNAFKFSIVRNPFSHLVSLYRYIRRSKSHQYHDKMMSLNFWQFLHWYVFEMMENEYPYGSNKYQYLHEFVTIDGELEVDYFGKLEYIHSAANKICQTIGISNIPFPKVNVFGGKQHWTTLYDERCIEFVNEQFKKDLELFDYEFQEKS